MADNNNRIGAAIAAAIAIAIPAEGLRQYAYKDPPGILTVCYGHTGQDVQAGRQYTLQECKGLLDRDMLKAINQVEACQPGLPVNVLAAFGDAAFNIGPKVACDIKNSTAARYLRAGKYIDACNQLPRWNKSTIAGQLVELPGLTTRRKKEQDFCLKGMS